MIWPWVAVAIALDGAAGLAGALVPEKWLERYRMVLLGFATGALLASVGSDLLPDAWRAEGARSIAWIAGAMIVMAIGTHAFGRRARPTALLVADAFHNIGDGVAITAAFLVSKHAGVATAAAVLVHELPEEIAAYALLRASGLAKGAALVRLAVVQLTAAIGAAGALLAAHALDRVDGILVSIAAGTFLHIALLDLAPEIVRDRKAVLAAIVAAVIVILV